MRYRRVEQYVVPPLERTEELGNPPARWAHGRTSLTEVPRGLPGEAVNPSEPRSKILLLTLFLLLFRKLHDARFANYGHSDLARI